MATTKKKSTTTKKPTTKKTAAKKPAAKTTAKKSTATRKSPPRKSTGVKRKSSAAANSVESFKLSKETKPFMTFTPTLETLYWIVLGVVVVAFTYLIMNLYAKVDAIYNEIDAANSEMVDITPEMYNKMNETSN